MLLLLLSCSTLGSDSAESDEEKTAVETLVSDCLLSVSSALVTENDLFTALSDSYTVYEEYLPSYSAIRTRYLASVSRIINDSFSQSFFSEVVTASGESLSANASVYISGKSVIADIEDATRETLTLRLGEYFSSRSSELEEAFSESSSSFGMVRRAYSSLSIIDEEISLPEAQPLDTSSLINITLDAFYSLLSSQETKLRNNPLYGDSVYRLFWSNQ